jgi:hypothetical protein
MEPQAGNQSNGCRLMNKVPKKTYETDIANLDLDQRRQWRRHRDRQQNR